MRRARKEDRKLDGGVGHEEEKTNERRHTTLLREAPPAAWAQVKLFHRLQLVAS